MTKKKSGTRWFVEPLDEHANACIAMFIRDSGSSADGGNSASYPDEDGCLHQVWEMPYRQISFLTGSRGKDGVRFRVYSMPPKGRGIREVPFMNPHGGGTRKGAARAIQTALTEARERR